jgi:hypothetical protein
VHRPLLVLDFRPPFTTPRPMRKIGISLLLFAGADEMAVGAESTLNPCHALAGPSPSFKKQTKSDPGLREY